MSKIDKLSKTLKALAKRPYLINKIIEDDSVYRDEIKAQYKEFEFGLPVIEYTDILPNLNEDITPFSFLGGGSLVTDLSLLKGSCRKYSDCTYFEIGTWRGESVSNVAEVAKECFTLNLSNEALKDLGYDEEYLNQQGFFSKEIKNITHLKGNSFEFDFTPYYGKCDVVFIDGDHRYESVVNDTKIAYKLLKDEGSIIIWHDYYLQPGTVRWDILKGIIDGSSKENIQKLSGISNSLCAIFTNKKYERTPNNKLTPTKKFTVNIKAEKL